MIRSVTLFSLIALVAANSCFAGKNRKARLKHKTHGMRVQNILNRRLDNTYHKKATQTPKNPVRVRSYVRRFQDFTAGELDALRPIMVELLNDHLLGHIDLTR
jgi:hypothetical protein